MIALTNVDQTKLLLGLLGAVATGIILAAFYFTAAGRSRMWTIIVTPLASIIGSGFLVVAPLLYGNFGRGSVLAIILINVYALGVGWVMRTNIRDFEPLLENAHGGRFLLATERLSNLALAISYVVSIAFYISLLSSFALELFALREPLLVRGLTTLLLAAIGGYGFLRGLHGMERLEKVAVNSKLSIIGGLVVVLAAARILPASGSATARPLAAFNPGLHSLQILGGMLLITQGFETARYLGKDYTRRERARAMLLAQLIAAAIYVAFVALAEPFSQTMEQVDETAIIQLVGAVALGLPVVLSIAAIFSQFGAGVADTVGTGGIVEEESRGRISRRVGYVIVCAMAVALIWVNDIFQVLTLASRAFAFYYALQAVIATVVTRRQNPGQQRVAKLVFFPVLALSLLLVAVFAISAH